MLALQVAQAGSSRTAAAPHGREAATAHASPRSSRQHASSSSTSAAVDATSAAVAALQLGARQEGGLGGAATAATPVCTSSPMGIRVWFHRRRGGSTSETLTCGVRGGAPSGVSPSPRFSDFDLSPQSSTRKWPHLWLNHSAKSMLWAAHTWGPYWLHVAGAS